MRDRPFLDTNVLVHAFARDDRRAGTALRVAGRYDCSIQDALVLAAALLAGCAAVPSWDMRHGQPIADGLVIRNPFGASPG